MDKDSSNNKINITLFSSKGVDNYSVESPFRLKNLISYGSKSRIQFHCNHAECGSCLIEILSGMDGVNKIDKIEKKFLKSIGARSNERLACRCIIHKDVSIRLVNEEDEDD